MSLRIKFSIVLALLVLTLSINVVLSVWSIRYLERELSWPLRSSHPVLAGLHRIKRIEDHEVDLLRGQSEIEENAVEKRALVGQRIIESEKNIEQELVELEHMPTILVRSGVSTTQNLRARSSEILVVSERWTETGTHEDLEQLFELIHVRHELIERVDGRILQDAKLALDYGEKLNFVVFSLIGVSVAGAVLSVVYAAILLRRWILEPVGHLREGAKRFGVGEFEHRIQVNTGDELGMLGDEFNSMSSMIKSMQDERIERERMAAVGEMAQRTVHNLRTPLAGIRALAETTKSELDDESELHDIQDRIVATVDRFEQWLQGMLRLSSPLEVQYCPYQPLQVIHHVVDSHRAAAGARSIEMVVNDDGLPSKAIGDPHHLEHALTSILSNAIDFSHENSTVNIDLGADDRYWTIRVRDQGDGIDPDLHVAIFRPYFTTRKSGTGIGLAMVKRIIEQHHGTVVVESPVDPVSASGTAFLLQIAIDAKSRV